MSEMNYMYMSMDIGKGVSPDITSATQQAKSNEAVKKTTFLECVAIVRHA
ncbi:hypothetical protein [Burkholderia ubonensis]|nr:hypothetical protein [Burkholderia ubonensis]